MGKTAEQTDQERMIEAYTAVKKIVQEMVGDQIKDAKKVYGGADTEVVAAERWIVHFGGTDDDGHRLAIVLNVSWTGYSSGWEVYTTSRIEAIDEKGNIIRTGRFLGPSLSRHASDGEGVGISSGAVSHTTWPLVKRQVKLCQAVAVAEQVAREQVAIPGKNS